MKKPLTFFRIKNFEKFQHYRDRNPPWIKIYKTLLTDFEYAKLPDSAKYHLIGLWLLASAHDGRLPCDSVALKRRLNASSNVNLNTLFDAGFIIQVDASENASNMLATCKQNVSPETETETETETEKEKHLSKSQKDAICDVREKVEIPKVKKSPEHEKWFEEDWNSYPRKAGNKKKSLAVYLKTVLNPELRVAFREKLDRYVASVNDPQFLKHAETFFRNWESIEVEITAEEEAEILWQKQAAANAKIMADEKEFLKSNADKIWRPEQRQSGNTGNTTPAEQSGRGAGDIELPVEGKQIDLSGEDYYHAGRILQRMQQKNLSRDAESNGRETTD